MAISFSISTTQWLYRMLSLVYVLSSLECGYRGFGVANGFEAPSSYTPSKRKHELIGRTEKQRSKFSPSRCKYDLGLGKNDPLLLKVDRQRTEDQERSKQKTTGTSNFAENDTTSTSSYDACRYLIEHEATRTYPAPLMTEKSEDTNQVNRPFPVVTATTRTSTLPFVSNKKKGTIAHKHKQSVTKALTMRTNHKSVPDVSERKRKQKQPVKVQPKRLLEDCLTILDHEFSDSSKASAPPSTNSIIWSRPDTPQLDMNSVWVEMLLHNQLTLSRTQG